MPTRKAHARWEGSLKEMALSLMLGNAGFRPDYVEEASFRQHAAAAKAGCPVSQALAGTEITLEASLVA